MVYNFSEFLDNILLESLHPELKEVVQSTESRKSKQSRIAAKIKDLSNRGESTGIEGNMPKGSSRAYLPHKEHEKIHIDGKPASIKTGTKVAIRAALDKHHPQEHGSLGAMQNEAENGDWHVNKAYRILNETEKKGHYETNKSSGIFPPLIEHDHDKHEWSHIGHVHDIKKSDFPKLTKTKHHPEGITHDNFVRALVRNHQRAHGRYWERTKEEEEHLDHVDTHPLVEKFHDYHSNYDAAPNDYRDIKNLGVFHHPDGSKHIVARDHGWNNHVSNAYHNARMKEINSRDHY